MAKESQLVSYRSVLGTEDVQSLHERARFTKKSLALEEISVALFERDSWAFAQLTGKYTREFNQHPSTEVALRASQLVEQVLVIARKINTLPPTGSETKVLQLSDHAIHLLNSPARGLAMLVFANQYNYSNKVFLSLVSSHSTVIEHTRAAFFSRATAHFFIWYLQRQRYLLLSGLDKNGFVELGHVGHTIAQLRELATQLLFITQQRKERGCRVFESGQMTALVYTLLEFTQILHANLLQIEVHSDADKPFLEKVHASADALNIIVTDLAALYPGTGVAAG